MRRYYGIDFLAMKKVGLNPTEWMICEAVGYSSSISDSGWAKETRAEYGEFFGISADRAKKIIRSLVDRGFLKKNKKHHLRVGKEWIKVTNMNGKPIPKDMPKDEQFPYHEDEFGEDEKASVEDAPSLNQVKKRAKELTKEGLSKELLEEIAESFWLKQESQRWDKVVDYAPLLRRYIKNWLKREEQKGKKVDKKKKVTNPKTAEEMRLFLKQMSDEQRKKIKVKRKVVNPYNEDEEREEIMVINHIGMPVVEESGEYCSTTDSNHLLEWLCHNYKKFL